MDIRTRRCQKCGAIFPATDQICPSCMVSQPKGAVSPSTDNSKAGGGRSHASGGHWSNVPISGMVPGVVMAVSHAHMACVSWLLPTGLAYGFCILNPSFRFSWFQKIVATAITLAIGTYGQELLLLFFHGNTHP